MERSHDYRSPEWDRYRNDSSPPRERDRDMYAPYGSRSPGRDDYPVRGGYEDRARSPPPHGREREWRERRDHSRSPLNDRRGDDYRDSPPRNGRYDDRRPRSPRRSRSHSRERDDGPAWLRDTTPVVVLSRIPENITENDIRMELQLFGAPIYDIEMNLESGPRGTRESVCFVEFVETRDAVKWMRQEKGYLPVRGEEIPMRFSDRRPRNRSYNELENRRSSERSGRHDDDKYERYDRRDNDREDRRSNRDRDDRRKEDRFPRRSDDRHERRFDDRGDRRRERERSEKKSDTMIVMGLDKLTVVETIRAAFEYITHFKIVDIRLVKDKFGVSRGFCFVQWESVDECAQVLEYLRTATPRFNIDGKQVTLHFSQPRFPEPQASSASANAAAAAIEAAKWSKVGGPKKPPPKSTAPEKLAQTAMDQVTSALKQEPPKPSSAPAPPKTMNWKANAMPQAPPLHGNMFPAPFTPQQPKRYPTPDISTYRYDMTSGFYFDPSTGLYYNAMTRYYYNGFTGVYLYWDQKTHNYIPVSNEIQAAQTQAANEKEKEAANTSAAPASSDASASDMSANAVPANSKEKSKTAKKIAKDMERWAKAQNKKKEEMKRLLEENTNNANRKESATVDAGFSLLEKKPTEAERLAAVKDAFADDMFKKPGLPGGLESKHSLGEVMSPLTMANHSEKTSIPGLSNYGESDSEEDEEPQLSLEEQIKQMIDWKKMACLLCRRAFASKDTLERHLEKSDLHKTNLETLRQKMKPSQSGNSESDQPKYRDRAAERRSKYGIADPPLKKGRYSASAPVPFEQPTKDGLDDTNIGNKMLQKMGWKSGSGLGKSQSGITVPIMAEQRTQGAGLGMRGSRLGRTRGSGTGDHYRDQLKQRTIARYFDAD